MVAYAGIARVKRALDDPAGARAAIQELAEACRQYMIPTTAGVEALRARFLIAEGDLKAAERWEQTNGLETSGLAETAAPPYSREGEAVILARLRLAQGRYSEAETRLDTLLASAEAGGRIGRVIELLLLRALAWQAQGQYAAALRDLRRALILAEPEGYIRTFVDEGPALAELLARLKAESRPDDSERLMAYVDRLLQAQGAEPAAPRVPPQPAVEALSARELEVLQLIAGGATNEEIRRRLVVSPNTVKTHVKNIYGKLVAGNRTQAVARARELGVL